MKCRSGHALKIMRPEGATDAGRAMVQQPLAGSDFATYRASIWVKAVDTDSGYVEPKLLKLRKDTTETKYRMQLLNYLLLVVACGVVTLVLIFVKKKVICE